jgi:hypothetical protein
MLLRLPPFAKQISGLRSSASGRTANGQRRPKLALLPEAGTPRKQGELSELAEKTEIFFLR